MTPETPPPVAEPRPPADHNPRTDPPLDFPDRDLGEMTSADYRDLNFMSGLEVHQQLLTRGKLFCRCPAGRRVTTVDAEVLRHMRPTLSELGEYDGCALMEFKTKKEIVYLLERGTVCTYEMDDTPPFEIDEESIQIALEFCLLLNVDLVSELHVMRKQYLDGSIPTGFQRTALVGLTGSIPFRVPDLGVDKPLRIRQVALEEDACREVSQSGHRITFRTDRLGTPLTEIVTEPDLLTPWEVRAGGRLLARVARATEKVRRGAGAARQDVNVSIAGGRRIELKGVGHHRRLPLLTHIEGFRQLNLLKIRAELRRRGVTAEMLRVPDVGKPWLQSPLVMDAGPSLRRSDYPPIREALDQKQTVVAMRLQGFGGLLAWKTQPGITFAREIAERVKVIACLMSRPFLIHSDVKDYGLTQAEWRSLAGRLHTERGDAIVVVWGPEEDAATAAREVFARGRDALAGVPAETRTTNLDGTSGFERILPGPDRMYPDTDTPPKAIPDLWIEAIRIRLAETPWAREDRYRSLGIGPLDAARLASIEPIAGLFDLLAPAAGEIARRLATALLKRPPRWLARRSLPIPPEAARLRPIVEAMQRGRFRPEAFERAIERALTERERPVDEILAAYLPTPGDAEEIERRIRETAERAGALARKSADAVLRWAMGEVMPPLIGRADPKEIRERLERALRGRATGTAPASRAKRPKVER